MSPVIGLRSSANVCPTSRPSTYHTLTHGLLVTNVHTFHKLTSFKTKVGDKNESKRPFLHFIYIQYSLKKSSLKVQPINKNKKENKIKSIIVLST